MGSISISSLELGQNIEISDREFLPFTTFGVIRVNNLKISYWSVEIWIINLPWTISYFPLMIYQSSHSIEANEIKINY